MLPQYVRAPLSGLRSFGTLLVAFCSVNEDPPGFFEDIPALIGRASCVMLASTIIAEVMTGKVRS